jgi:uncharacterized protein (DUF433 family)
MKAVGKSPAAKTLESRGLLAKDPDMPLPIILVPHPHVRVDPNVLGGSPFVVGSRVPVRRLWAFFRTGVAVDKILRRYPQLGPAKVFDALAFALDNPEVIEADVAREEEALARAGHRPPSRSNGPEQIELPFLGGEAPSARPRKRR